MRKIKVKRLIYSHDPNMGKIEAYGGEEYEGYISDENILSIIFDINCCEWSPCWKNMIIQKKNDEIWYIQVQTFYRYEKTWIDALVDNIKRILRI